MIEDNKDTKDEVNIRFHCIYGIHCRMRQRGRKSLCIFILIVDGGCAVRRTVVTALLLMMPSGFDTQQYNDKSMGCLSSPFSFRLS